jgi:hypothetical protein
MHASIAGGDQIQLRFQTGSHAGENEAAEWVIPLGIGVAVQGPIAGCGVAHDKGWLAVEQIVHSNSQFPPLANPKGAGDIEIILRG